MSNFLQSNTKCPTKGNSYNQLRVVRLDPPFDPRCIRLALALAAGYLVAPAPVRDRVMQRVIKAVH